jgi:hypothetical protein
MKHVLCGEKKQNRTLVEFGRLDDNIEMDFKRNKV